MRAGALTLAAIAALACARPAAQQPEPGSPTSAHARRPSRHAATVRLRIRDAAGEPVAARLTTWSNGVPHDPVVMRGSLGWRTRRQDFVPGAGERSVYVRGDAELAVPPGTLRLVVTRGPHHEAVTRELALEPGGHVSLDVSLRRWASLDGWRCGDLHLHLARLHPERDGPLRALFDAEDLDVAVLVDWAGRADGRFAAGWGGWSWRPEHLAEEALDDGGLVLAGQGWGRPDRACVLAALGHATPIEGRSRHSPAAIVESVRDEGGIAMGTMGDIPLDGALLGRLAATEVLSHGRMELEAWYTLLNAGARLAAVAGSDTQGGSAPETLVDYHTPPGASRVCVHTGGALDRATFLEGIRGGATFVSSGPVLELEVNGRRPGAELTTSRVAARIRMSASVVPGGWLRLIENGRVVWERPADAHAIDVTVERALERSAWLAARLDGEARTPAGDVAVAHTSPVYVTIDGPVRDPEAIAALRARLPDPAAIAESGRSTAEERAAALEWTTEARRRLDALAAGPTP